MDILAGSPASFIKTSGGRVDLPDGHDSEAH
jgi:hypothetical protein